MDTWIIELVKQVPSAVIIYMVIKLFIDDNKIREQQRALNAKERDVAQRDHQAELSRINGQYITQIVSAVQGGNEKIALALESHDKASAERYERMGITKDLIDKLEEVNRDSLKSRK